MVGEIEWQIFRRKLCAGELLLGKKSLVKSTPNVLSTSCHIRFPHCIVFLDYFRWFVKTNVKVLPKHKAIGISHNWAVVTQLYTCIFHIRVHFLKCLSWVMLVNVHQSRKFGFKSFLSRTKWSIINKIINNNNNNNVIKVLDITLFVWAPSDVPSPWPTPISSPPTHGFVFQWFVCKDQKDESVFLSNW